MPPQGQVVRGAAYAEGKDGYQRSIRFVQRGRMRFLIWCESGVSLPRLRRDEEMPKLGRLHICQGRIEVISVDNPALAEGYRPR